MDINELVFPNSEIIFEWNNRLNNLFNDVKFISIFEKDNKNEFVKVLMNNCLPGFIDRSLIMAKKHGSINILTFMNNISKNIKYDINIHPNDEDFNICKYKLILYDTIKNDNVDLYIKLKEMFPYFIPLIKYPEEYRMDLYPFEELQWIVKYKSINILNNIENIIYIMNGNIAEDKFLNEKKHLMNNLWRIVLNDKGSSNRVVINFLRNNMMSFPTSDDEDIINNLLDSSLILPPLKYEIIKQMLNTYEYVDYQDILEHFINKYRKGREEIIFLLAETVDRYQLPMTYEIKNTMKKKKILSNMVNKAKNREEFNYIINMFLQKYMYEWEEIEEEIGTIQ